MNNNQHIQLILQQIVKCKNIWHGDSLYCTVFEDNPARSCIPWQKCSTAIRKETHVPHHAICIVIIFDDDGIIYFYSIQHILSLSLFLIPGIYIFLSNEV